MSSPAQSAPEEPVTDPDRAAGPPSGQADQQTPQPTGEERTTRVSRSVSEPVAHVWEVLISPEGTQALLGAGASLGNKGEAWHSQDGTHGVVRSYHPMEQLRVSWHADADAPATLVDLHLVPQEDGTRLDLVHERLPADAPGDLGVRWEAALGRLAEEIAG